MIRFLERGLSLSDVAHEAGIRTRHKLFPGIYLPTKADGVYFVPQGDINALSALIAQGHAGEGYSICPVAGGNVLAPTKWVEKTRPIKDTTMVDPSRIPEMVIHVI